MGSLTALHRRIVRLAAALSVLVGVGLPLQAVTAQQSHGVTRLGVRVTSAASASTVEGIVFALDSSGQAITNLTPDMLQTSIDGTQVRLSFSGSRPSIALVSAFLLDSSASPRVRTAVANAAADGLQGLDVNRDSVAVVSTADATPWDRARFTATASDLQDGLNQVIQTSPVDSAASLEQVSNAMRALRAQPGDARALLLFINRPLASLASVNASLGTLRSFASENGIQVSIVALPGAGGQGPAEALAEATPGGRVEYVLNATNRQDIAHRISLLLAPVFGARRFQLPAPAEGLHTMSVGAPGADAAATTTFQVSVRSAQIESIQSTAGTLKSGDPVAEPTWVEVRPSDEVPIDSIEWTVDGRVTQVASAPWALLLDPDQLGDGRHELTARITSRGRAGPIFFTTFSTPPDFLRTVRNVVRNWGVIALLLFGEVVVVVLFLRAARGAPSGGATVTDFPPTLRLNPLAGTYVAPEVIDFPARGKLRIGYHPPFMDNQVGSREFSKLPYQDIRGDEDAVKDLSRHAACIWRDPKTNDCYIQLGWPGPGEPINPKPQSQVFHFGRPQDASTSASRLAHHDVVRLGTGVEFVFNQVGLRDKPTPEGKKLTPFEPRATSAGRVAVLSDAARRHATASQETMAEER